MVPYGQKFDSWRDVSRDVSSLSQILHGAALLTTGAVPPPLFPTRSSQNKTISCNSLITLPSIANGDSKTSALGKH